MFIGTLLIIVFFSSLPWVWVDLSHMGVFAIRPSVLAALPVALLFFWKGGVEKIKKDFKYMFFLLIFFLILIIPVVLNEYPHWSAEKILSVYFYLVLAYFSAHSYLALSLNAKWRRMWPVTVSIFLISIASSYYMAFGTLLPDMGIDSSTSFIHKILYGTLELKGLRHTMAIVPVILIAVVIHNKNIHSTLNLVISIFSLYLIVFTFSRSAWLASFLILLLYSRLIFKEFRRSFGKYITLGLGVVFFISVFINMYPEITSWAWGLVSDRMTEDGSTSGRLWVVGHVFYDMRWDEYFTGYDRASYYSPHNMMLDALMQSGILGMICATTIVIYAGRIFIRGFFGSRERDIVAAIFVVPAFVRMFTAGSGMLHIAELFAFFVAVNFNFYFDKERVGNQD